MKRNWARGGWLVVALLAASCRMPGAGRPDSAADPAAELRTARRQMEADLHTQREAAEQSDRELALLGEDLRAVRERAAALQERWDAVATGRQAAAAADEETARRLQEQAVRVDELAAAMRRQAEESAQLQRQLEAERAARERDRQVAAEREKELKDLRRALATQERMLKQRPEKAVPPAAETPPGKLTAASVTTSAEAVRAVALANNLLKAGRLDEAQQLFDVALRFDREMMGARVGLAACLYAREDYPATSEAVDDILRADARNAQALGIKGLLAWREGDLKGATRALEQALAADPSDAQLHNYMGIVLHTSHRTPEAIRALQKAVELDPDNAEACFNLAVLQATARPPQLDAARTLYEKALSMGNARDPDLDRILYPSKKE